MDLLTGVQHREAETDGLSTILLADVAVRVPGGISLCFSHNLAMTYQGGGVNIIKISFTDSDTDVSNACVAKLGLQSNPDMYGLAP